MCFTPLPATAATFLSVYLVLEWSSLYVVLVFVPHIYLQVTQMCAVCSKTEDFLLDGSLKTPNNCYAK